jgi:hypothetical protein
MCRFFLYDESSFQNFFKVKFKFCVKYGLYKADLKEMRCEEVWIVFIRLSKVAIGGQVPNYEPSIQVEVFWVVTPCRVVLGYSRF